MNYKIQPIIVYKIFILSLISFLLSYGGVIALILFFNDKIIFYISSDAFFGPAPFLIILTEVVVGISFGSFLTAQIASFLGFNNKKKIFVTYFLIWFLTIFPMILWMLTPSELGEISNPPEGI